MKQELEQRTVVRDPGLRIEAYELRGVVRPFPNHFHEHLVIGLIEQGERRLTCRNQTCTVGAGSVLVFRPGDSHACTHTSGSGRPLTYSCLQIPWDIAAGIAGDGRSVLTVAPGAAPSDPEAADLLRLVLDSVLSGADSLQTEELLYLLFTRLGSQNAASGDSAGPGRQEIERACRFMDERYAEHITLDDICRSVGLSKSALLRAFAKTKGITPYRYLLSVRVSRAQELLRQGIAIAETAALAGFADQSHLTNYFTQLVGLTPGCYRALFVGRSCRPERSTK